MYEVTLTFTGKISGKSKSFDYPSLSNLSYQGREEFLNYFLHYRKNKSNQKDENALLPAFDGELTIVGSATFALPDLSFADAQNLIIYLRKFFTRKHMYDDSKSP